MHDHRHSYMGLRSRDTEDRESTRAVPGKTTLVEQMRLAMPAQTSSPSETAGPTSPGPTRSAAPTGAEPKGELKKAIDHPERKGAPRRRYAKQGALNRGNVESNRVQNGVTKARPGVTLPGLPADGAPANGKVDEFTLNKNAARYIIKVETGQGEPVDQLAQGDYVYVNPVGAREMLLAGESSPVWCVLTWRGSKGAAWMKVDDLMRGEEIKNAANEKGARFSPKNDKVRNLAPSVNNAVRFTFCTPTDALNNTEAEAKPAIKGQPATGNQPAIKSQPAKEGLYIKNPQKEPHSNQAEHYLPRLVHHDENDASKDTQQINICLNLPSADAPPVAADVARSGEYFFVTNDRACVAEVSLFKRDRHKAKAKLTQIWVFGFVGKSATEPDKRRYGWVPAVALQQA